MIIKMQYLVCSNKITIELGILSLSSGFILIVGGGSFQYAHTRH